MLQPTQTFDLIPDKHNACRIKRQLMQASTNKTERLTTLSRQNHQIFFTFVRFGSAHRRLNPIYTTQEALFRFFLGPVGSADFK